MRIDRWMGELRCVECRAGVLALDDATEELNCSTCGRGFEIVNGCPVLLRNDDTVFPPHAYRSRKITAQPARHGRNTLDRMIPTPSVNLASERVLGRMRERLAQEGSAKVIVVGGGAQRQWLDHRLGVGRTIRTVYLDIDSNADIDLFANAHDIPFADGIFDACVTTAVLEHVMYPERAVSEIHRVLKVGGLIYSELPFMQQVHEGAYDFTRYTLSGHRRLLNGFAELESGMVAGPATALVWSLENFALAFASRPTARKALKAGVRLACGWIKYVDRALEERPEAMDGASCTYFLGSKSDQKTPDQDIIARYWGAKSLSHY